MSWMTWAETEPSASLGSQALHSSFLLRPFTPFCVSPMAPLLRLTPKYQAVGSVIWFGSMSADDMPKSLFIPPFEVSCRAFNHWIWTRLWTQIEPRSHPYPIAIFYGDCQWLSHSLLVKLRSYSLCLIHPTRLKESTGKSESMLE